MELTWWKIIIGIVVIILVLFVIMPRQLGKAMGSIFEYILGLFH